MTLVKVCGVTRVEDAVTAAEAGADLIGFIFAPSPRRADPSVVGRISARLAEGWPLVGRVGVFVDPTAEDVGRVALEASLTHVQIHGAAPTPLPTGLPWIAAMSLGSAEDAGRFLGTVAGAERMIGSAEDAGRVAGMADGSWALLIDTKAPGLAGGTGETFPWRWAAPIVLRRRVIVAGGLDAERVEMLLKDLTPFGVDASSRLEKMPGIKDPEKVRAFVRAVRRMERKES